MKHLTVTAEHAPVAVERLGAALGGAWHWWERVAFAPATGALGRLAAALLLLWAVTWAVRLERDRRRSQVRVRIAARGRRRLAEGAPPDDVSREPGS